MDNSTRAELAIKGEAVGFGISLPLREQSVNILHAALVPLRAYSNFHDSFHWSLQAGLFSLLQLHGRCSTSPSLFSFLVVLETFAFQNLADPMGSRFKNGRNAWELNFTRPRVEQWGSLKVLTCFLIRVLSQVTAPNISFIISSFFKSKHLLTMATLIDLSPPFCVFWFCSALQHVNGFSPSYNHVGIFISYLSYCE